MAKVRKEGGARCLRAFSPCSLLSELPLFCQQLFSFVPRPRFWFCCCCRPLSSRGRKRLRRFCKSGGLMVGVRSFAVGRVSSSLCWAPHTVIRGALGTKTL